MIESINSPDEIRFRKIFIMVCEQLNMPFDESSYQHLLDEWYIKGKRDLQSVHPRDLLNIIKALCEYLNQPLHMTPSLLDEACLSYFVDPTG